jgi:hypothetical protein
MIVFNEIETLLLASKFSTLPTGILTHSIQTCWPQNISDTAKGSVFLAVMPQTHGSQVGNIYDCKFFCTGMQK